MLYELATLVPFHLVASAEDWLRAALEPWIWLPIIHICFDIIQRTASVTLTPEYIVISAKGKKTRLERKLDHQWHAITHDKAEREHDDGRTGKLRYYGRARTLCLIHQGTRYDILDVHDSRIAVKYMNHCIEADQYMESQLSRGKGRSLRSVDGFAKQAGGLRK